MKCPKTAFLAYQSSTSLCTFQIYIKAFQITHGTNTVSTSFLFSCLMDFFLKTPCMKRIEPDLMGNVKEEAGSHFIFWLFWEGSDRLCACAVGDSVRRRDDRANMMGGKKRICAQHSRKRRKERVHYTSCFYFLVSAALAV